MKKMNLVRAACLLGIASAGMIGCGDDDGERTSSDASAATTFDGATPGGDAAGPRPLLDAGLVSGEEVNGGASDGGVTAVDASALANAPLPARTLLTGPEATGVCELLVDDASCDKTKLPIVFVHGTVANADSFAHPAKLFASNGYCPDRIRGIEYHSLIGSVGDGGFVLDRAATYAGAKKAIDAEIAALQAEFGVTQVDLAGHSQGAAHGATYAAENPTKVAHYVHMAGGELAADPGGVPTLSLSSIGDRPVNSKVTKNVVFQDPWLDHSAVSCSTESFVEMYKFLNAGAEPKYTTVQCGSPIVLEGKAQTLGENKPLPGSKIEVHELHDEPWQRGAPVQSFIIGPDAKFGPFEAKPGVAYEFVLVPAPDDTTRRLAHSYFPPFVRSNRLLRLNFESKDPIAGATSTRVNVDPSFSVIVPRTLQKAFLADRDTLTVDGREVLSRATTLTVAPATGMVRSAVIVAFYLFDRSITPGARGPGDGVSTGESILSGPFQNSADLFIPAAPAKFVQVGYNGRTLKVPNWPSSTHSPSVVFVN
jgi:pimeloyl-ACP methyl ester carboxylesterase